MKVLMIAPYLTIESNPLFTRNKTGFGYMVYDIAKFVGQIEKVDFFASMVFTPKFEIDGFRVLGWSRAMLLKGFKFRYLNGALKFLKTHKLSLKDSLRVTYQFLAIGAIEKLVSDYDIVHIHGCNPLSEAVMISCKHKGIPFVVTLHGLNSFEQVVKLQPSLKRYEKEFLVAAKEQAINTTLISSGMLNQIRDYLKSETLPYYYVVTNGCVVTTTEPITDIRGKYGISKDKFVLLCVGNLSKRKNQLQIVRASNLLPKELKNRLKVLLVGKINDASSGLVEYIENNGFAERVIICGGVEKSLVGDYYRAADATVLASLSEGFGLSIIEGFVYGLPNLTYRDLPAVADLYDPTAMICVEERSDEALAKGIAQIMSLNWDREAIGKYSENFSLEKMAKQYVEVYKQAQQ